MAAPLQKGTEHMGTILRDENTFCRTKNGLLVFWCLVFWGCCGFSACVPVPMYGSR